MNSNELDKIFDQLFPICRSIAGPGIQSSLKVLQKYLPLTIEKVPSGTKVFDWVVPQEWKLNKATLKTKSGKQILSTEDTNLHVLNFSEPFKGEVTKQELEKHLHSIPELPDAIPYVTSYYNPKWGLCIADAERQKLLEPTYLVDIDVEKYDGHLTYGEVFLAGQTSQTILITAYLCHPSMANNELSGPLALVALYKYIASLKSRRFSYRFLIIPETIGSITYLATKGSKTIKDIVGGIVLTCLGGPSEKISFKRSRKAWLGEESIIDKLAKDFAALEGGKYCLREFTPTSGSDERQFCSPSINLPVIQAAKTIYGDYEQYHTSLDTKDFMQISSVVESVNSLQLFLSALEIADIKLKPSIKGGEPMLSRHDLYPTLNGPMTKKMSTDGKADLREQLNLLLNTLSLVDGTRTITDIAAKLSVPFSQLMPIVSQLMRKKVVKI